jgi:hypothetical protein
LERNKFRVNADWSSRFWRFVLGQKAKFLRALVLAVITVRLRIIQVPWEIPTEGIYGDTTEKYQDDLSS